MRLLRLAFRLMSRAESFLVEARARTEWMVRPPAFELRFFRDGALFSIGNSQGVCCGASRPLPLRGDDIRIDFVAPAGELVEIIVYFATFQRRNTCQVLFEIGDVDAPNADAAGSVRLAADPACIEDNAPFPISLRGVRLRAGKTYRLAIRSPDAGTNNHFGVWSSVAEQDDALEYRFVGVEPNPHFLPKTAKSVNPNILVVFSDPVEGVGETLAFLKAHVGAEAFDVTALRNLYSAYGDLVARDVVIFANFRTMPGDAAVSFDHLAFALHVAGVFTVSLSIDCSAVMAADTAFRIRGALAARLRDDRQTRRRCHAMLTRRVDGAAAWQGPFLPAADVPATAYLQEMARRFRLSRAPAVDLIASVDGSSVATILSRLASQRYEGSLAALLVVGQTMEEVAAALATWQTGHDGKNVPNVTLCRDRAAAQAQCRGEIVIFTDKESSIGDRLVATHVFEHWFPDVDVVAESFVTDQMRDGGSTYGDRLQGIEDMGFLACLSGHFSIKRRLIDDEQTSEGEPLLRVDDDIALWRNLELGYRLYQRAARFVSVGSTAAAALSRGRSGEKGRASDALKSFNGFLERQPDAALILRRWITAKTAAVLEQPNPNDAPLADEKAAIKAKMPWLNGSAPALLPPRAGRRLRILTHRWHCAHQYELYKLPHDFTLLTGAGSHMCNYWDYEIRPLRPNARLRDIASVDLRDFDLCLLHFDEHVLATKLSNGVLAPDWGQSMRFLMENTALPKVAVCHGTPAFVGQFGVDRAFIADFEIHEEERRKLVSYFSQVPVVCNSFQAQDEWQFAKSRVIWHGFDPLEFPQTTYRRDVLTIDGPASERPHYRGLHHLRAIRSRLAPDIVCETVAHEECGIRPRDDNRYAAAKFRAYVDRIRLFTAYLNPTIRSPMPRSRGEAMMCGVVPVSILNHDVERFIENEKNGFFSKDPAELADVLNFLCADKERARRIGAAARRTALDLFNNDRYLAQWDSLLDEIL